MPSLPSLDPFLRLQAFSFWSGRSLQFVVPNSQRGVFVSNGFASYWRRVQKSFVDYVGFGKIERIPNLDILSTPIANKRLSLPTAGIVSTAISSKTGFVEWHASRGGWCVMPRIFQKLGHDVTSLLALLLVCPLKKGQ